MERENKKEKRKSKENRKKRVLKSGAKMRELLERKSE